MLYNQIYPYCVKHKSFSSINILIKRGIYIYIYMELTTNLIDGEHIKSLSHIFVV